MGLENSLFQMTEWKLVSGYESGSVAKWVFCEHAMIWGQVPWLWPAEYWITATFGTQAARPGESCNCVWALLGLEILQWQHSSQEQAGRISGRDPWHYTIFTWHYIINTQETSDVLPWIQLFISISNELILPLFGHLQSWRSEPVMPCLSLLPM